MSEHLVDSLCTLTISVYHHPSDPLGVWTANCRELDSTSASMQPHLAIAALASAMVLKIESVARLESITPVEAMAWIRKEVAARRLGSES